MNILRLVIQLNGHVMRVQEVQPVVQCHSTIRGFPRIHHSASSARIVLEHTKFNKKVRDLQ